MQITRLFTLLIILFIQHNAYGLNPISSDSVDVSIFKKIVQDSIDHIIIAADFELLLKGRFEKDWPKQVATITLKNREMEWQLPVKIELRGRFRRKICDMPPIKLDFVKRDLAELGFNPEYDELKLVTHCLNNPDSDQTLLKEYWTYRLHNEITPNSFKVHLVRITYLDINQPAETRERMAFIIENNQELAARIGGELVNKFGMTPSKVEEDSYHYSLMFNYMIGNLDWNILVQRNIKYIQKGESLIVVPYDFDHAALVKAPYAKPHPDYKQKKLEDRFCVGRFSSKDKLIAMAEEFIKNKKNLLIFEECSYLEEKYKLRMSSYLSSFYEEIQEEKQLKKAFMSKK